MHFEMSFAQRRPFYSGPDVLIQIDISTYHAFVIAQSVTLHVDNHLQTYELGRHLIFLSPLSTCPIYIRDSNLRIAVLANGPVPTLIARFMGPTWCPSGADRTQVGPMLAPWTLLSG